ncbi:MAG: hypothetical protein GY809_26875 [Planctomycetes bacterium]|nr:hypothetical protein [Planctomycetota bacterium]
MSPDDKNGSFWYRTAVPGHEFNVAMNHYDDAGQWMSGRNNEVPGIGP